MEHSNNLSHSIVKRGCTFNSPIDSNVHKRAKTSQVMTHSWKSPTEKAWKTLGFTKDLDKEKETSKDDYTREEIAEKEDNEEKKFDDEEEKEFDDADEFKIMEDLINEYCIDYSSDEEETMQQPMEKEEKPFLKEKDMTCPLIMYIDSIHIQIEH